MSCCNFFWIFYTELLVIYHVIYSIYYSLKPRYPHHLSSIAWSHPASTSLPGICRAVGALIMFHCMYYKKPPKSICQVLPGHPYIVRRYIKSHDLAFEVPSFHSSARIWNALQESIPALEKRAHFKQEVNSYLGTNPCLESLLTLKYRFSQPISYLFHSN